MAVVRHRSIVASVAIQAATMFRCTLRQAVQIMGVAFIEGDGGSIRPERCRRHARSSNCKHGSDDKNPLVHDLPFQIATSPLTTSAVTTGASP